MVSLTSFSSLFATALIITICAATKPLDFVLPFTSRQNLASCTIDSDCSVSGCTCIGKAGDKHCLNRQTATKEVTACSKCATSSDCPGDKRGCNSDFSRCQTCTLSGVFVAMQACSTSATATQTAKPTDTPSGGGTAVILSGSCTNSTSCSNGCTCSADLGNVCVKMSVALSKFEACPTCDSDSQCGGASCDVSSKKCESCLVEAAKAANKACSKPDCIATAWLRERNLEHAALRHYGMARVLCFPGLPCGTEGHILRECTNDGSECKLVTYREVCERRDDCIRTTTAVSKLSHTYPWASHRVISKTTLELTSLSADTLSTPRSLSRLVAYAGDYLNRMGLGWITNSVVLFLSDGVQNFFLDITAQS